MSLQDGSCHPLENRTHYVWTVGLQECGTEMHRQHAVIRYDNSVRLCFLVTSHPIGKRKGKEEYLYSAFYILCISQSAQAWISQFYLQIPHACLSFISVHQMAPPLTEVRDIQLQLTTHLSTPKG